MSSRKLCPRAKRIALFASPSSPARWFRPSSALPFMWPVTGSMAFHWRISRRTEGDAVPRVWETTTLKPFRRTPFWP